MSRRPPRTSRSRQRGRQAPARRTSPSDILGLLVLTLTAALAACTAKKGPDPAPGGPASRPGGTVTVRFFDVGQGDAVLISSPEGKNLLVDGGRSAPRMAELLQKYGVGSLDMVVATHADADHITGLTEAARLRPRLFINNGLGGTTQTWDRVVAAMQEAGATFQKANNQVVNLGSVQVRVMAAPDGVPGTQNDHSVGIRVDFGDFHALLTGDSEKPETQGWLAEHRPETQGPVQVYKSIHHGAANGDHQAWLEAVQPQNVVISVGPNNYGHPTQAALDLYTRNNVHLYRTDRQGTVTFSGKSNGQYRVTTER